jgi:hypothetical protein
MGNQHNEWAATELDLLRQTYPVGGAKAAARVLPGRSLQTIAKRAQLMGIRRLSAAGVPRKPRTSPRRAETFRLPHEPISELDRIGLYPWGYMASKGQLRPMVRVELENAA